MGIRRQARELAVQVLFRADFNSDWALESAIECSNFYCRDKNIQRFANKLISGVLESKVELDTSITKASENWSISRMSRVDRSILRVSSYEIVYLRDVPVNVSINEAIEVAKKFSSEDSANFINGVVDKIASNYDLTYQPEVLKIA